MAALVETLIGINLASLDHGPVGATATVILYLLLALQLLSPLALLARRIGRG